jgi:hypothetical protein
LIASLAGFSNAGMIPSRRLGNKNVKDIDVANSAGNKYSAHKRTRSYIPYRLFTHVQHLINSLHFKKRLAIFLSPAGMSLTKLSLGGNNL